MNIQDQEKYQKAIFASARSEAVINRLIDNQTQERQSEKDRVRQN